MSLNKTELAEAIKDALDSTYEQAKNPEIDGNVVREYFSNQIANAFDNYIKGIVITIGPGLVLVSGTSTNQTNAAPIVIQNEPPSSIT